MDRENKKTPGLAAPMPTTQDGVGVVLAIERIRSEPLALIFLDDGAVWKIVVVALVTRPVIRSQPFAHGG